MPHDDPGSVLPRGDAAPVLLRARGLTLDHDRPRRPARRRTVATDRLHAPALAGVDLDVRAGEALGVVGASGSGKSTLLSVLLALDTPDTGTVTHRGRAVRPGPVRRLRWFRREVQHVPQDPASSLDPRAPVTDLVAAPLRHLGDPPGYEGRAGRDRAVAEALDAVQLPAALRSRRAGELSGGQAQRVAIARALVLRPGLLLADEPVSGLDPPLRAAVLAVLRGVCADLGTALVVVTHDLSALAGLCARTVVIDAGRLVEDRPTAELLRSPLHVATRSLVDALPRLPR